MITELNSKKLVVISDLHLGNPFCKAKQRTVDFIHWAARNGYDICINGDGFEIAQASFSKIARDVPDIFQAIKSVAKQGHVIYYVVGNHDMLLENFLNDWGGFRVVPFLNVWSGSSRVRIEHGHLYDPFFVRSPQVYEFATWLGGIVLQVAPAAYRLWIYFEKLRSRLLHRQGKVIVGESYAFAQAAKELTDRGFDHVIFGHTHHVGRVVLGPTQTYLNPGSWLLGTDFVEIVDGQVRLMKWNPKMPHDLTPSLGLA